MKADEIEKLEEPKLNYKMTDLEPVMSKETVELHFGTLTRNYVKKYNETKDPFQYAGAFLHSIWWKQFDRGVNRPGQNFLKLVGGNFTDFKDKFVETALTIQGAGWIYLNKKGEIKIIKNHEVKKDIVLIIDMWEHAFLLDYKANKKKYLENIWTIINWDTIEQRIGLS